MASSIASHNRFIRNPYYQIYGWNCRVRNNYPLKQYSKMKLSRQFEVSQFFLLKGFERKKKLTSKNESTKKKLS